MKKNIFLISILIFDLFIVSVILFDYISPEIIENYYSKMIYPVIIKPLAMVSDRMKDESCTEIFVITVIILLIGYIWKLIFNKSYSISIILLFKRLFYLISIPFIIFYIVWGFNFFRVPLKERIPYDSTKINIDNLILNLDQMIDSANKLYTRQYPSIDIINNLVNTSITNIVYKVDHIQYYDQMPKWSKTLLINIILNYMQISGITIPFFQEIYYNESLLVYELPMVLAHEKAHLLGYTGEGEANFLAYLACINADDFSKLSGQLSAMPYFLSQLKRKDILKYKELKNKIRPEIMEIYKEISLRHKKYEGFISNIQNKVNNTYLQVNKIQGGVEDYGMMVAYILGFKGFKSSSIKTDTE